MSDVYIERRPDTDFKKEYWLWHRMLYNGPRPILPLWQVDIVREDHLLADGFGWIGSFLASVVSTEDVAGNWTVVDKAAWTYYKSTADGGASLGTGDPTADGSWSLSTSGVDDTQTGAAVSHQSYRTTSAGAKAEYEFTITANEIGACVDLQMLLWGVNFGDTHIGVTKDAAPFALNGRGTDPGEVYLGDGFVTWTKNQPWDANGNTVDGFQPNNMNFPMEVLRNLEPGTYKITLTHNGVGARRCGPGRLRIRKHQTEIMPDDANRQLWFAEYTIDATYTHVGAFLHGNGTSDVLAVTKLGLGFVGGPAHGEETQTAATWTKDGGAFDAAGMAEGDITAGTEFILSTTTMVDEDNLGVDLVEMDATYTFNAQGLTVSVDLTWQQDCTLAVCYIGMYSPGVRARVPAPFRPDYIQFGIDDPVARGGTEQGYDVTRRAWSYGDIEGDERNVGRKMVCTTADPSGYGDFDSTLEKVFIITGGKTYVKIAGGTSVTTGLKWSNLWTRYNFVEANYPGRAVNVTGQASVLHGQR